ncbi:hypothetical protein QBC32DRAFT_372521 [Pseudoneurospora amorphoporcata]|uniref:Uncharacterized protein n=1 Tax=Pseudoneurospora amorphoporcata TaxID=241081 RepID=A0AAN6NT53_9PEZI|nr:hypothetical protein QBC32DRAFT_372521 [Pseudoneurospora amorphoporcata]
MATTARKARTYWMGAEPLNGLYGLRAFSLLNLGPHSEATGAVNTANQVLSTGTGVVRCSTRACKIAGRGPLESLGRGTRAVVRSVVPSLRLLLARVRN